MMIRRIVFIVLITIIHCLSWFYFTCFIEIYPNMYNEIINIFLIMLILKYIVAEIILTTLKWILKKTKISIIYDFFVY